MMRCAVAVLAFLTAVAGGGAVRAAELVYFNSSACPVCERWDEEIGGLYDKTDEAKRLPLRHQNIHENTPEDLSFIKGVVFTPTFVVVENGREVGRMVGYVQDYFFWEQLSGLIEKADAAKGTQSTACAERSAIDRRAVC